MTVSLNEVAATAKKAARGAGYPWGLAEEAAFAAVWLCSKGFDGCAALAAVLKEADGKELELLMPRLSESVWNVEGGVMCPISAGATLSDRAILLPVGDIHLENVAAPLLMVPFLASAARQNGRTMRIRWAQIECVTDGEGVSGREDDNSTADAVISFDGVLGDARPTVSRGSPTPETWSALSAFADRTYAPATEASRLKGAGAGITDND